MYYLKQKNYIRSNLIYILRTKAKIAPFALAEKCLILKEWEGHKDKVSCMSKIDKPLGFVTGSVDKYVKLWSYLGEEWGVINILADYSVIRWNFPYNWNEIREIEKNNVIEVMKEIEPEILLQNFKVQYIDDDPSNLKKKNVKTEKIPKRSIAGHHSILKLKSKHSKILRIEKTNSEEEERPKFTRIEREPERPLIHDLMSFIDMYKDLSPDKKLELCKSVNDLKDQIRKKLYNK